MAGSTGSYERDVDTLERELGIIEDTFRGLLARRTVAGRPTDLAGDDLAWIRAASGRQQHPDPRLPLIG